MVVVFAAVLGIVPSGQATTNLVPNHDFENNCSGIPCNWSGFVSTIARDTTTKHGGSASVKLTLDGSALLGGAASDCVNMPISAGSHASSVWYETNDATAADVGFGGTFFAGANCTGGNVGVPTQSFVTVLGAWTQIQFTFNIPANPAVQSVQFIVLGIAGTLGQKPVINFDDFDFETEVLAVTVSSFTAGRSHKGVLLRWHTGTEVDELGFNVFRQVGHGRIKVNRRLLPALGAVAGSSYSFLDRRAPRHRAVRYWLQDVSVDGARAWHGPVRVGAS